MEATCRFENHSQIMFQRKETAGDGEKVKHRIKKKTRLRTRLMLEVVFAWERKCHDVS